MKKYDGERKRKRIRGELKQKPLTQLEGEKIQPGTAI